MKTYKQVLINIDELKGYENNSRVHSDTQINQIANSIKEYGFTNPLLITENKTIIAGHGRLEAVKIPNRVDYKDTPINKIPCIVLSGLSQNDYKALVIADNKIALNAGWDLDILKDELESLENENYDMNLLGFSDSEISEILDSVSDNDGDKQVYSNKELDFNNDDFSKNITLCFDNLEDFRMVNSVLLKRDNDYAKAVIKLCKEIDND